ncbi:MAG: hypothetical protein E7Z89_05740 [Cyanobacteria bacterium SIG28]|nr:hypothetical protein [Cyanobacteria bacterium SIG28]
MIIKYNSIKSNRLACIGSIIFFGTLSLVTFYSERIYLFWLFIFMTFAGFMATFISFYKNSFDVLDVKIDTEKRIVSYNATSNNGQEYKDKIIHFSQIKYVNVELTTSRSESDSIKFWTDNDLSFSIPIQHNQIKELEKFFEINYVMSEDLETNFSRKTKIKKLYKSGLLGSMFSPKGFIFSLIIFILFMLNLFIIIPLSNYLFNMGTSNNIISFVVGVELILFMCVMTILWKIFR